MSRTSRLVVEHDIRVPMRDGVDLATDVYRLDDAPPGPVLLHRTPYDRTGVPIASTLESM